MNIAEFVYTVLLKPKPLRIVANGVLRSLIPSVLQIGNARIALNPRDPVVSGALTLRVYEKPETEFFVATFGPDMSFLDIGANVGYYTALALSITKSPNRIIAIEPDPESFHYLKQTVSENRGVGTVCVNKAAADEAGTKILYTSEDNRGDSRLYDNNLCTCACTVDAVTVDRLLESLDMKTIDFVKMDVQGYEGHVLRGMQRTLGSSAPMILLTEFWPYGLRCAGSEPNEVLENLESFNFVLFELTHKAQLRRIQSYQELVERFPGRRYTNVVGIRNVTLPEGMFTH